jgi:hypothetical protein
MWEDVFRAERYRSDFSLSGIAGWTGNSEAGLPRFVVGRPAARLLRRLLIHLASGPSWSDKVAQFYAATDT